MNSNDNKNKKEEIEINDSFETFVDQFSEDLITSIDKYKLIYFHN